MYKVTMPEPVAYVPVRLSKESNRVVDGTPMWNQVYEAGGYTYPGPKRPLYFNAPPQPAEPSGYAYRYRTHDGETVIRFNNGGEVNGSKPVEAIPYWFSPQPAKQAPEKQNENI